MRKDIVEVSFQIRAWDLDGSIARLREIVEDAEVTGDRVMDRELRPLLDALSGALRYPVTEPEALEDQFKDEQEDDDPEIDYPTGYDPDEDRSPDSFDPPDRDEKGEW